MLMLQIIQMLNPDKSFQLSREDEKDNLYIVNCRYLKNHLHNFTVEYKLPAKEIEFFRRTKKKIG